MATPLSDEIRALIAFANETTNAGDTKLGDAVRTLCNGYGGGGGSGIPENEVWYITNDGNIIEPYSTTGVPAIVSNTFEFGRGKIVFASAPTTLGTIFRGRENLTGIMIPNNIATLPSYALYQCTNLKEIHGFEGVKTVGVGAFADDASLVSDINLPELTSLSGAAFKGCASLTRIVSLGKLTAIPGTANVGGWNGVFSGCSALTEINLHEGITSIGEQAFNQCGSLEQLTIPSTVGTFATLVFRYCKKLLTINMLPATPPTISAGVFSYAESTSRIIYVPSSSLSAYTSTSPWSGWNIQAKD